MFNSTPWNSTLGLGLLAALSLSACGETSSADVDIPGGLAAHYDFSTLVTPSGPPPEVIELSAYFQSGLDDVIFDQGEVLYVRGIPMERDGKDFYAELPIDEEPAEFEFRLEVPDRGSFVSVIEWNQT